tara:strand:+ start:748 stop:1044 length:297 start_codon:yes stop_codon:yes gene_type:complete
MQFIKIFQNRKLLILNISLFLYVFTNLAGGERGVISYFKKKNIETNLINKKINLSKELRELENKNLLLSKKINLDYLDIIYRQKLKFGKKNEIVVRFK